MFRIEGFFFSPVKLETAWRWVNLHCIMCNKTVTFPATTVTISAISYTLLANLVMKVIS
jgi:hypothetical protein